MPADRQPTAASNPSSRAPVARRFWVVLVASVLVAAGASQTIAALRSGADQSRQAITAVARLDAGVNREAAIRWQAARDGTTRPTLEAWLVESRTEIDAVLATLAAVERASFGLRDVVAGATAYERVLEDQTRTVATDPSRAEVLGRTVVEPAFRSFREARDRASERLGAAAASSGAAADLGTLLALLSAAILVSLFFRKWERIRRRTAWQEGARTGVELSESRFRALVQHGTDLVMVVEPDGRIAWTSPSVAALLGELAPVGLAISDLVHPDDVTVVARAIDAVGRGRAGRSAEWRMRNASGRWQTFEYLVSPGQDALRGRLILNGRDVTERKDLEDRLRHQAQHDPLTGLANRALLRETIQRAASRSRRQRTSIALLMLDLDAFKSVNDTFGHAAGDELLVGIAGRLRGCVRTESLVARISGDEFAVLLEDVDAATAEQVADRLVEVMRPPFLLREHAVAASFSVGVAVGVAGEPPVDILLRQADLAMYAAKSGRPGTWVRYAPDPLDSEIARAS